MVSTLNQTPNMTDRVINMENEENKQAAEKPAPKTRKTSAARVSTKTKEAKAEAAKPATPKTRTPRASKKVAADAAAPSEPAAAKPARKPRTPKAKVDAPAEAVAPAAEKPAAKRAPRAKKAAVEVPAEKPAVAIVKEEFTLPSPEAAPAKDGGAVNDNQRNNNRNKNQNRDQRNKRDHRDQNEGNGGFATPELVGGGDGNGGNKNKKRRNRRNRRGGEGQANPSAPSDVKVDPELLQECAWKIFLGEVTEEGLALLDDRSTAEVSRRAFRTAELFLMEAARRLERNARGPQQNMDADADDVDSGDDFDGSDD